MRMAVSRRWIAAISGPWLALVVAEPPVLELCAAHSASHTASHGVAHAGHENSHPNVALPASHAAAEVNAAPVQPLPDELPRCTCPDGFSHAGVFRLPDSCEIRVPPVVIVEPGNVTSEAPAVLPTAPPFLRPFSIGPPVQLAA